jgi:formylglycine-generating enzyme
MPNMETPHIVRNQWSKLGWFLTPLLILGISLNFVPNADATSTSASLRIVKKLKKQIKSLKAQLEIALRPTPVPTPFVQMVAVGDPGNAADPEDGDGTNGGIQNFGAVPYEFKIGKYEITLTQYTAFLNAVAATDTHSLYNPTMESNPNIAGIGRSGVSGGFTYTVIGSGTRPVTNVSWFDAARFCNWLHNERPTGAQDTNTTESGAYSLNGATSGVGFSRQWGARYWIPSEDEWYKSAYHQPSSGGGDGDGYWLYPTRSNNSPGNLIGGIANQANFNNGVYSVTRNASLDPASNYLTDGGVYAGSASFYGTYDQGGNAWEWNDEVIGGSLRGLRGGSWDFGEYLISSFRNVGLTPGFENSYLGFRIAAP